MNTKGLPRTERARLKREARKDVRRTGPGFPAVLRRLTRETSAWLRSDEETGEEYPPIWVAEVRYRIGDEMRVVTMDLEHGDGDATDEIWAHEVEVLVR